MNLSDYVPVESCQIPGLETIYELVFGLKTDGVFVEVGAFDGKTYSNTYQLAKLGWKGLYIEPVDHLFQQCCKNHANHPNVDVVHVFASDVDDEYVQVYKWGDNTFTGNKDFIHNVAHDQVERLCVATTKTLSALLDAYDISNIDLMVIDVEGHELQVLNGLLWPWHYAKMMIVEVHELSDNPGLRMHSDEINAKMLDLGYEKIYADAINSIFVRRE